MINEIQKENWNKLTTEEKAIVLTYKKKLEKGTEPKDMMQLMIKVNQIHCKYPEFSMFDTP